MESLRTKIKQGTEHIALDAQEKALMRERLVSYMEYQPLRTETPKRNPETASFRVFFRAHHFVGAMMIAVLVTTSTFSVSSAASDALPGDLLYPVKVHINEGVKTVFMTSDEARIAHERQRAETRLEEAGMLASQGRLDSEAQEEVTKRFAEHTEAVVEKVRAVEDSDPVLAAEASSEFAEALDTHEAVLARLIVEQEDEVQEGARELVGAVHAASAEAQQIRDDAEQKIALADTDTGVAEDDEDVTEQSDAGDEQGNNVTTAVEVREDRAAKIDSPNLHERAAYRAQARAIEELARAQELVAHMGDDSELTAPAKAQLASGEVLMLAGEQALVEHDLGVAYSAYRNAAAKFQKVADLLEAAELFDVQIYTDVLDEVEEASAVADVEEDESTKQEDEVAADAEVEQNNDTELETMRVAAEDKVREARRLLLGLEGFESDTVRKANKLIKDASANILRGEIYLVLEEAPEAYALYEAAHKHADRAVAMLLDAAEERGVEKVQPQEDEEVEDEEVVADADEPAEVEPTETATDTLQVLHTYHDGVHTYAGNLAVGTSCTQVAADLLVAESFPEQVTLVLTTAAPAPEAVCDEVGTIVLFEATTTASEAARFVGVTQDGEEVAWELVERAYESEEDALPEDATKEEEPGLLRRALDGAADYLGGSE